MKLIDALFLKQPWLITPEAHAAMVGAAQTFFQTPPDALPEAPQSPLLSVEDGVGIVSIEGPFLRKPDLISRLIFGATDTEEIIAAVQEAGARDDVQAIFLDIDSPGSSTNGTPELAQAVADAAKDKYVYAYSGGLMCSGAYWVASQCDAIYVTPSARVGSIGVILPVRDVSEALHKDGIRVEVFAAGKYKSAGIPGVPLTDDQRALLQAGVEEVAAEFHAAVLARGRRIPPEAMEGQTFSARAAMKMNLAGTVKSRAHALRMLRERHVKATA